MGSRVTTESFDVGPGGMRIHGNGREERGGRCISLLDSMSVGWRNTKKAVGIWLGGSPKFKYWIVEETKQGNNFSVPAWCIMSPLLKTKWPSRYVFQCPPCPPYFERVSSI
jgi:hypothetical protein